MSDDIASLARAYLNDAAAPAGADPASGWARPVLDRQLWVLGQLAEAGLEIARAIERQATQEAAGSNSPVAQGDIPLAYARVARAVRLTIMLQSKLIADLQKLEAHARIDASHAKIRQDAARPGLMRQRRTRIQRIIGRVAWADGQDRAEVEQRMREAGDQLDQDDVYGDVLSRPVSELVALICRTLGLKPDWPVLAQHAWAQEEIRSGAAGAPLAAIGKALNPQDHQESASSSQTAQPLSEDPADPGPKLGADTRAQVFAAGSSGSPFRRPEDDGGG